MGCLWSQCGGTSTLPSVGIRVRGPLPLSHLHCAPPLALSMQ